MGRRVLERSIIAVAVAAISPAFIGPAAAQQSGTLTVTPQRGPIGTRVAVVAAGCADPAPGQNTVISFQGGDLAHSTAGADEVAVFTVDSLDPFRTTYTIPAKLETLGGEGGGPVIPGRYEFRTYPPGCSASFVVTGLATTGPSGVPLVTAALLGGLLLAAGSVMVRARSGLAASRDVP